MVKLLLSLLFLVPMAHATEPTQPERLQLARKATQSIISERFKAKNLPYPPRQIFLRAFKKERLLELWARESTGPFVLIHTYPVLAASGELGPKLRQGDYQVPEGFYQIDRFNPLSSFHLSLGLDYPNASDRRYADPQKPGGDIFIHGSNVSAGCLALGDPAIEEVFLSAWDARKRGQRAIYVHIFPAHMSGPDWDTFSQKVISDYTAPETGAPEKLNLAQYWKQLRRGYLQFEKDHLSVEKPALSGH